MKYVVNKSSDHTQNLERKILSNSSSSAGRHPVSGLNESRSFGSGNGRLNRNANIPEAS